MKRVAVILVNYRTASLTLRALASLEREQAAHPELRLSVWVVENASGDEAELSLAIRERFARLARLIVSPVNGGFGAGNNLGLARALEEAPDYLHFLNPDTEVRSGAVAALVEFLEQHPRVGLAGGSFEQQDGTPWPIAFRFPSLWSEIDLGCRLGLVSRMLRSRIVARQMESRPAPADWISGASLLCRRQVLQAVGGFDEGFFLYFEEIDLCRRIWQAGWECWYVPESRVMHIRGASTGVTSLRRLPRYWFESRKRYFRKHHGLGYAKLVDAAALAANLLGLVKDRLIGRAVTPHLVRDLARHSVLP